MLKVKAYHFNPINITCLVMLFVVLCTVLSFKPMTAEDRNTNIVNSRNYENIHMPGIGDSEVEYYEGEEYNYAHNGNHNHKYTHEYQYKRKFLKDYQLEITNYGKTIIIWDGNRWVGSCSFEKCRIIEILDKDNL